mgnify:CR=1 FL=1
MQFYDSVNQRAICSEIDRLCDTSDTSYSRLAKTARVNDALEEVVGKLITADGLWQWDDTNQTDLPRGTGNLVEGRQSYSFTSEYLTIREIDILTLSAGVYRRIEPIDPDMLGGFSPEEYFGVTSGNPTTGFPQWYDKEGDSIRLWPAPTATACTLTAGIRVWFQRTAVLFTPVSTTAADTTEPGFPSPYHVVLAYMAAIPYCMSYKPNRVALYQSKVDKILGVDGRSGDLIRFYTKRDKDDRKIMTMKSVNRL